MSARGIPRCPYSRRQSIETTVKAAGPEGSIAGFLDGAQIPRAAGTATIVSQPLAAFSCEPVGVLGIGA
jgi:hypothetical protein